jgi:hypothetical protein
LQLAQKVGEPALLGVREGAEEPALVLQVRLGGAVDEFATGGGKRDQGAAPVVGVRLARDEARLLEPVQTLGGGRSR